MNQPNILSNLSKKQHLELIYLLWHNWLQKVPSCKKAEYKLEEYQKLSLADLEALQAKLEKNVFYPQNSGLNLFIAASTIPITPFKEILNSLLLKTPIICRLPEDFDLSFYKLFESACPNNLKDFVKFISWTSNDLKITQEYINKSDCIIVHGKDETINLLKQMSLGKHFLGFGHKASFIVCKPELSCISAIVSDIEAFGQKGCLSPQVIYYLEKEESILNFAQNLSIAIKKVNFNLSPAEAYQKQNIIEQIYLCGENKVIGENIIISENSQFEYIPMAGLVWLKPLKDLSALNTATARLDGRIGAIGTNLPESLLKEFFYKVRICELGEMQKPSLLWLQEPTHYNL